MYQYLLINGGLHSTTPGRLQYVNDMIELMTEKKFKLDILAMEKL